MLKETFKDLLVKYVYHETTPDEKSTIESLIQSYPDWEEEFYNFIHFKKQMEEAELKPSMAVTNRILQFSKAYQTEETIQ